MRKFHPAIAISLIFAFAGAAFSYFYFVRQTEEGEIAATETAEMQHPATLVTLSRAIIDSLDLKLAKSETRDLAPTTIIPGRLQFDETKHVSIDTACQGIVKELLVLPGQSVQAGDVVAVISSPEVGAARSEVAQCRANLALAQRQLKWTEKVRDGVNQLVSQIRASVTPERIEESLKNASLGQYREQLVSAYSRARLAAKLEDSIRSAVSSGAVTSRVQVEREAEVQEADAALVAAIEQSVFEVEQAFMQDAAATEKASQQLQVSIERLQLLLGPWAGQQSDSHATESASDSLSSVNLISPLSGIVQEHFASKFERVDAGQALLVIADTTSLWAVADVREKDWAATSGSVGDDVEISTSLIPDLKFTAKLIIIGPNVDPRTGAMPVVARLEANDPRLKPGVFVRVKIRCGQSRSVLTIPESAIAVHEGSSFVFVPSGDDAFRRVDVTVGESQDGIVEITGGIEPGASVVINGVFKLQSELLLSGEGE